MKPARRKGKTSSDKAPAAIEGHVVTPLAVSGRREAIEGAEVEGAAMLKFRTCDQAQAWDDRPASRGAREHRWNGADDRAVIVEGL